MDFKIIWNQILQFKVFKRIAAIKNNLVQAKQQDCYKYPCSVIIIEPGNFELESFLSEHDWYLREDQSCKKSLWWGSR